VISKLIDTRQFAFLEGRGLLDSVLVANEALGEVSWEFLYYMLGRLGFCEKWSRWIKSCLESSSMSVLVNGSPTPQFHSKRGLRQGDPLAPFLFLIVAEGLTGGVRKTVEKNMVESLEVGVQKV